MSNGSALISSVGSLVGYIGPQTGPAAAATLSTVATGNLGETGASLTVLTNAMGADISNSTILHGVANSVAAVGALPGVTSVISPAVAPVLQGQLSEVAAATQTPVTLLAPHTGPAASAVIVAIGQGNVTATGQATGALVTAAGVDITQSTILHGVSSTVTSVTNSGSFHFPTTSGLGTDSLNGVLHEMPSGAHPVAAASAPSTPAAVAHFDIPFEHPLHTLAHAAHHA